MIEHMICPIVKMLLFLEQCKQGLGSVKLTSAVEIAFLGGVVLLMKMVVLKSNASAWENVANHLHWCFLLVPPAPVFAQAWQTYMHTHAHVHMHAHTYMHIRIYTCTSSNADRL